MHAHSRPDALPLLITGVAGVPGYNAFRYFADRHPGQVVGLRREKNWPLAGDGIVGVDLEDKGAVATLFERYRFRTVLDAEGTCALKSCELDPKMAWRANVLGAKHVVPHMPSGSSIINVSSLNGLAAQAGTAAYTASKFGLRGLTRAAALDLGPKGIRVNAILPGVIRTPMVSYVVESHEAELAAGLPLRRIGEPDDIADAAVFLASDGSRWITGTDVTVDGGLMAGTPRLI